MWAFLILATVYLEAYGSCLLFDATPSGTWLGDPDRRPLAVLGFLQDLIAVMAWSAWRCSRSSGCSNQPEQLGRKSRFKGSHLGRRLARRCS